MKKKMKDISLNNGRTYMTAEEAMPEILERGLWDSVVNAMDPEIREKAHALAAPCSELAFLEMYLELADEDLIIG